MAINDEGMNEENGGDEEGMSTTQKVVAGAALGVAVPAAVGVAKKILGNGGSYSVEVLDG